MSTDTREFIPVGMYETRQAARNAAKAMVKFTSSQDFNTSQEWVACKAKRKENGVMVDCHAIVRKS